jgi:hypothetical protein
MQNKPVMECFYKYPGPWIMNVGNYPYLCSADYGVNDFPVPMVYYY